MKIVTKGGDERWIDIATTLLQFNGQPAGLVTGFDVTDRKEMEAQMLSAQKLAGLGTLAGGVAHEINSPLQVITGVSQSLLTRANQGPVESERLIRNLDMVHRNGWRCAEIVRALLTYSRPSVQQHEAQDLNALIHDSLLLIEHQLKSWSNVVVNTELAPDLPELCCDQNQITQVLINLLTNARDAMPEGGFITIRSGYDVESQRLYLQVKDTGSGIPESIRARIFDPFFTTKPVGKGTGLGLSVVSGIVRSHGGEITIDSAPNQGTTFNLFFPKDGPIGKDTPASRAEGRFDETGIPPSLPVMIKPVSSEEVIHA